MRVAGCLFATVLVLLAFAAGAQAVTYHYMVTTTADTDGTACDPSPDSGPPADPTCSIREAIKAATANGSGFVDVPAGTYVVGTPLSVTKGITITGTDGPRATRISGGHTTRVFTIANSTSTSVTLQGLTIADGETTNGGAGIAISGSNPVQIVESAIVDNHASVNPGAGILIGQDGYVLINRSLIARNSTSLNGGGIYLHAGTGSTGTSAVILNTTIAGNSANDGSGIFVQHGPAGHQNIADLRGVTVARNDSSNGNMLTGEPASGSDAGGVYTRLTLVADPIHGGTCDPGVDLSDNGDSVETSTPCGFPTVHTSQNVALGPLEDNGGPTDTMALGNGSQALDVGFSFTEDDQRGNGRTNFDLFGAPDAGAYEAVKGADLSLSAPQVPGPITAGDTVTYTLTVSSAALAGNDAAEPRVHVAVPAGAALVSAAPSQGSCAGADCTLGRLDNGSSATIAVTLRAGAAGTMTTDATVSSPRTDSVPGNDSISLTTNVNPAPISPGAVKDTTKPVFAALKLSPTVFQAQGSGPSVAKVRGTHVTYTLSESGTVAFAVQQKRSGRKVGKRCVKPTKKNAARRSCKRTVTVGRFTRASSAGANSFHFTGRVGGHRLPPGAYKFVGTAKDAAGNKSTAVSKSFRIIR